MICSTAAVVTRTISAALTAVPAIVTPKQPAVTMAAIFDQVRMVVSPSFV
jgi:hypothetical protein